MKDVTADSIRIENISILIENENTEDLAQKCTPHTSADQPIPYYRSRQIHESSQIWDLYDIYYGSSGTCALATGQSWINILTDKAIQLHIRT